jgi:hypothetical protein
MICGSMAVMICGSMTVVICDSMAVMICGSMTVIAPRDDSDDDDDDNGDDGHEHQMVWEQSLGRASAHAWWRERGGERNIFTYI